MKSFYTTALVVGALSIGAVAAEQKGWTDNYTQAVSKAKAEKKYLLLDFTGSDWCGFCKVLDKEVFNTPQFESWAKKNVVLVTVDFPHQLQLSPQVKKQNSELMSKYPTRGFPTIVVTDADGKELAKETGYRPGTGAAAYVQKLETELKKNGPLPGETNGGGSTSSNGGVQEPSIFKTPPAGLK